MDGAVENRELLIADGAELGLLQASAVSSDDVAVATPLYPEAVYFLVRGDSGVHRVEKLASRTVVIGEPGSGMRLSARRILDRLEIAPHLVEAGFSELANHPEWDGAIVTIGPGTVRSNHSFGTMDVSFCRWKARTSNGSPARYFGRIRSGPVSWSRRPLGASPSRLKTSEPWRR